MTPRGQLDGQVVHTASGTDGPRGGWWEVGPDGQSEERGGQTQGQLGREMLRETGRQQADSRGQGPLLTWEGPWNPEFQGLDAGREGGR